MPDPKVAKWKQKGCVYVWHYRDNLRNHPGWHMTADNDGCDALLELFDLMQHAEYSSRATVKLSEPHPLDVSITNPGSRWYHAHSLEIRYPKDRMDERTWTLAEERGAITLIVGKENLQELRECIADVQQGGGDYALGPDDNSGDMELWFWWQRSGNKRRK